MKHLSLEMRSGSSDRTVIDLHASGYTVLEGYFPETSEGERVTDHFDLAILGTSDADLQAKVRAVELALDFAGQHQTGPDGVWLLYSPKSTITAWQSRITGGAVLHDKKLARRWVEIKARVEVVIERMPYFETEAPVTLATSNTIGSAGAVVNHEDAGTGHDFYLEIADTQVTGMLPTPAIIEFKNTVNDARTVDNLYVGHFAESKPIGAPTVETLILEGAGTVDAACSGGSYAALPWTGTGINQLTTWSLVTTFMGQRHFKLIARFRDTFAYTDLWLKAKLMAGTLVLAETRWEMMGASKELQLIGTMQIPPFKHGSYVDLGTLTVALYEKRAGGDGTINLDYIALVPQDSWRHYGAITGLAYNKTLIDNPLLDLLVTNYLTAYEVTHLVESGQPIMLQPGVKNILYFLHDTDTGTAPIARTATVTVKCHPRRRTV